MGRFEDLGWFGVWAHFLKIVRLEVGGRGLAPRNEGSGPRVSALNIGWLSRQLDEVILGFCCRSTHSEEVHYEYIRTCAACGP